MTLSEFFGRFIYTRKCASCGELLEYELSGEAFCPECREKWETQKVEPCRVCGRAVCECECMTRLLERSGAVMHRKIVKYSLSSPAVHNTLMFIKRNNNPRVSDFLASQLASLLIADKNMSELITEEAVVTFLPRSRAAIVKYGHDQSEIVARILAHKLGTRFIPIIKRKRKRAVAQKKLNAKARAKNVKNMFEISAKKRSLVEGKTVLVFDDIVTTGASMGACVTHLIRAGARIVVCLSIATTENSK